MSARRQHLIDTAFRLFNEHGYHATGIDWILAESGVSKATLYKYFPSKDDLILEVLRQRHEALLENSRKKMIEAQERGDEPVLAMFDVLQDWFKSPDFYGCNFIKAGAEYIQATDEIHRYAAQHKARMQKLIESFISAENAATLARQFALLIDGAIVSAHTHGDPKASTVAKAMALTLLQQNADKT